MTEISLEDVTKEFVDPNGETIVAVDTISLEIDDGEFLVLVGPSGCGKTTTLRMIAGLEAPTNGEIRFDGDLVNDVRARNRDVAMVFQNFALYPHMTVRENMAFGLERSNEDYSSDEVDRRVEDAAEMLEIGRLLDQKPENISGGQQQRVALGRAIVRDPRVFLFDEPLANLDEKLQGTMRTEIVELQQEFGVTSVYVTHNQEEAMTVADRIAVLNDGKLQQIGEPKEVYTHPANLFVAQFIGSPSMNLFDATVERHNGGRMVVTDAFSLPLPDEHTPAGVDQAEAEGRGGFTLGIRPEDLSFLDERVAGNGSFEAEVRVVEPLGRDALVYTDVGGVRITARLSDYDDVERGAPLELTVDPEDVYLFDGETSQLVKSKT